MNLFAIMRKPATTILRLALSRDVQNKIQKLFAEQYVRFMEGVEESHTFNGSYTPSKHEILKIDTFKGGSDLLETTQNPLSFDQFYPELHYFEDIKGVFTGHKIDGLTKILIQLFEKRRVSNTGFSLIYSQKTFHHISDAGLTLDTKLLAVLEDTTLMFKNFFLLRRVFDLTGYYREATNEEVNTFANHPSLCSDNIEEFVASANESIRRKITLISEAKILDLYSVEEIMEIAQNLCPTLKVNSENRIMLPKKGDELRTLLAFLNEDLYESQISQTRYISNSKRRV